MFDDELPPKDRNKKDRLYIVEFYKKNSEDLIRERIVTFHASVARKMVKQTHGADVDIQEIIKHDLIPYRVTCDVHNETKGFTIFLEPHFSQEYVAEQAARFYGTKEFKVISVKEVID